jgi:hypothetical protein
MALIVIATNVSQLAAVSDYRYEVLIGDGTVERSTVITRGVIKKHRRDDGWRALVQRILDKGGK